MILSLDPSLRSTGFVCMEGGEVQKCGNIVTKKDSRARYVGLDYAYRAEVMCRRLDKVVQEMGPSAVISELPHGSQSEKAAKAFGIIIGVISAWTAIRELPIEWCTARDGKIALTGNPKATKKEMITKAINNYKYDKFPEAQGKMEHIADAIGVYLALRDKSLVRLYG